ncbi:hypothetical protein K439DRAFT_1378493 [Ramaria rubella]|nr:hypothetical protein K439DRAFT_1378493 [Ramaria rubella]
MPFSARNARYLRISAHVVLPLYVYLDDQHVEWMSDYTLQRVLENLRPLIGPKLQTENSLQSAGGTAHSRKGTVDVFQSDTYQFAYFIRKNEPHAVLIKNRRFVPTPALVKVPFPQQPDRTSQKRKRARESTGSLESRIMTATQTSDRFEEDEGALSDTITNQRTTRPGGQKNIVTGHQGMENHNDDVPTDGNLDTHNEPTAQDDTDEIEPEVSQILHIGTEDEEEEKPKLTMKVSYQGFAIYNRCLCVIIEPRPPLRASREPSIAPSLSGMRMTSVTPTELHGRTPMPLRERTPLFLPEIDTRRSITPAPLPSRFLPPVPLFDDDAEAEDQEKDDGEDGMMAFSQVLRSVGGERAGSADEDETEGDVFLGDADERRGGD